MDDFYASAAVAFLHLKDVFPKTSGVFSHNSGAGLEWLAQTDSDVFKSSVERFIGLGFLSESNSGHCVTERGFLLLDQLTGHGRFESAIESKNRSNTIKEFRTEMVSILKCSQ